MEETKPPMNADATPMNAEIEMIISIGVYQRLSAAWSLLRVGILLLDVDLNLDHE